MKDLMLPLMETQRRLLMCEYRLKTSISSKLNLKHTVFTNIHVPTNIENIRIFNSFNELSFYILKVKQVHTQP